MTICDVCKDLNKPTTKISIAFNDGKSDTKEYVIDFCAQCAEYVAVNSLIIGINEIIKHKVKKQNE